MALRHHIVDTPMVSRSLLFSSSLFSFQSLLWHNQLGRLTNNPGNQRWLFNSQVKYRCVSFGPCSKIPGPKTPSWILGQRKHLPKTLWSPRALKEPNPFLHRELLANGQALEAHGEGLKPTIALGLACTIGSKPFLVTSRMTKLEYLPGLFNQSLRFKQK